MYCERPASPAHQTARQTCSPFRVQLVWREASDVQPRPRVHLHTHPQKWEFMLAGAMSMDKSTGQAGLLARAGAFREAQRGPGLDAFLDAS